MESLSHHEVTTLLVSLAVLLGVARLLGELAQWFHQPAVVGEILAGLLLGPTVLGTLRPEWNAALFPLDGPVALVLDGLTTLAITLFLLVAGMEVDLSTAWRQGGAAIRVGLCGVIIPFALGFFVAICVPRALGQQPSADPLVFSLFFATAISISALPVVVRILMDLDLYRSDFGMVVVAASVLIDLIGWIVFALILGMTGDRHVSPLPIYWTIVLTFAFTAFILTIGRWLIHRFLPWLQAHTEGSGGVMGFAMTAALLGAAFTESIGVHAILGSFMVGVAIGDSSHLRERTRMILDRFISYIFAPLFFASIGLRVNFATNFDLSLVLFVLLIATVTKLLGAMVGARWSGLAKRESWAVAFALNARGAMEIILGLLALQANLIHTRLFVALVVMALATSMASGPMILRMLRRRKRVNVVSLLNSATYIHRLKGRQLHEVISELSAVAAAKAKLHNDDVEAAVMAREQILHTGIGHGVALPHARLAGLPAPVVALGFSEEGIDFDAPDGEPAQVILLILTPVEDNGVQLDILSSIATALRSRSTVDRILGARNLVEVIAILKGVT